MYEREMMSVRGTIVLCVCVCGAKEANSQGLDGSQSMQKIIDDDHRLIVAKRSTDHGCRHGWGYAAYGSF